MKLNNSTVMKTVDNAKALLKKEKTLSPALRSILLLLFAFMQVMFEHLSLNSKNSSKPPSTDQNGKKKKTRKRNTNNKPGGQPGRTGKQLKPVHDPDQIEEIKLDKRTLPKGNYTKSGFEARQVIDFEISICITEYRAEVLVDDNGKRYVASFPVHVKRPIQYGQKTKASAVYMSQYQLIPYARIADYFSQQVGINISTGSLYNFNQEAYKALEAFEEIAKSKLIESSVVHADETGINVNGVRIWLHTACNDKWTHFFPHKKRGTEAMNEIGILPNFKGVLCHDHWKPYYTYDCYHALCNAHHLRELEWSSTQAKQAWAKKMIKFLLNLNNKVNSVGGVLNAAKQNYYEKRYHIILSEGEKECPAPDIPPGKKKRGRQKKTKPRNLLERLINYADDVLRFMREIDVPFTNNQGENDLRMTKVQQKISGCFRSEDGARIFCRVRGYLITCRKHGIGPTEALETLFKGKLPDFAR